METLLQEEKKRGSLRNTFIFLFIIIACVPILGLGTVSLLGIASSHKKNISELERQTLVSTSEVTSVFFNTLIDTLSINIDALEESRKKEETTSWQENYAKNFTESNQAFLEISFVGREGKEIAKYSKINKATTLLYLEEFPLYKEAKSGKIAISPIHSTIKGQTVTIAVPLFVNKELLNVVIAEVSLSPLINALEKIHIGKTGYVLLFDKEGTLVGSKNTNQTSFFTWKRVKEILDGKTFDGLSKEDRYQSLISNASVVSSGTRIPKLNWALIIEWPTIESDNLVENFRQTILASIIISITLVLFLALFVAQRLVMPIKQLQSATEDIEKGNFDNLITIHTDNELEDLSESFNRMSVGLKQLEELKNEFVYVAAHELRAPVTAIKGYMELIFDGAAGQMSPEMEHLLSPVRKSNDRLVNLVNDLLKVARSEAGKLEISLSSVDISKEISAILEEIKPLAMKRNMTVIYNSDNATPFAKVNSGSFKEIIMNFASNAVKYGNDNGTITVFHTTTETTIATSIQDNGRGISEEDQQHLFQKFFRAGEVKKTEIEGTGLGLFITKELVEKMNGTLTVHSVLGEGTTFTVTFQKEIATELTKTVPEENKI